LVDPDILVQYLLLLFISEILFNAEKVADLLKCRDLTKVALGIFVNKSKYTCGVFPFRRAASCWQPSRYRDGISK